MLGSQEQTLGQEQEQKQEQETGTGNTPCEMAMDHGWTPARPATALPLPGWFTAVDCRAWSTPSGWAEDDG